MRLVCIRGLELRGLTHTNIFLAFHQTILRAVLSANFIDRRRVSFVDAKYLGRCYGHLADRRGARNSRFVHVRASVSACDDGVGAGRRASEATDQGESIQDKAGEHIVFCQSGGMQLQYALDFLKNELSWEFQIPGFQANSIPTEADFIAALLPDIRGWHRGYVAPHPPLFCRQI